MSTTLSDTPKSSIPAFAEVYPTRIFDIVLADGTPVRVEGHIPRCGENGILEILVLVDDESIWTLQLFAKDAWRSCSTAAPTFEQVQAMKKYADTKRAFTQQEQGQLSGKLDPRLRN